MVLLLALSVTRPSTVLLLVVLVAVFGALSDGGNSGAVTALAFGLTSLSSSLATCHRYGCCHRRHHRLSKAIMLRSSSSSTCWSRYSWTSKVGVSVWRLMSSPTNENSSDEEVWEFEIPRLMPNAKATDFFADRAFYSGYELMDPMVLEKARKDAFGERTVQEVFARCESEKDVLSLFSQLGIDRIWALEYFEMLRSLEGTLVAAGIISLNLKHDPEVDRIKSFYAPDGVSVDGVPTGDDGRKLPVYMVLGSSGSGKTFYAVKNAATDEINGPMATLYVKPKGEFRPFEEGYFSDGFPDASSFVSRIKATIAKRYGSAYASPLNIHISVVVDEAGGTDLDGYFESISRLQSICVALEELAISTRLVVCGTGVEGRNLCSDTDVIKCRMQPWQSKQMKAVLLENFGMTTPDRDLAVAAIRRHPTLRALSSNARSAFFLLQHVYKAYRQVVRHPIHWDSFLDSRAAAIVDVVVATYIGSNALDELVLDRNELDRCCVVAAVFRAVELAQGSMETPNFIELPFTVRHMAVCVMDWNVDFRRGEMVYVDPTKPCPVSVSPALLLVLCSLLGVESNVLATWDALELITALHAFSKRILAIYKPYALACIEAQESLLSAPMSKHSRDENDVRDMFWGLQHKLKQVVLVRLDRPVPGGHGTSKHVRVPRLGQVDAIWINDPMASFATIVAPYTLYHCLGRASTMADSQEMVIDLKEELSKCGLLKRQRSNSRSRVVLRALIEKWEPCIRSSSSSSSSSTTPNKPEAKDKAGVVGCRRPRYTVRFRRRFGSYLYQQRQSRPLAGNKQSTLDGNKARSMDKSPQQHDGGYLSNAYPFDALLLGTGSKQLETISYNVISASKQNRNTWLRKSNGMVLSDLPLALTQPLRFVIVTNSAQQVVLKLDDHNGIGTVTFVPLEINAGRVNTMALESNDIYSGFMSKVLDFVKVEFLIA